MPRYFFNVRDGSYYPDEDGTDLRNLEAAQQQAVSVAGELLKNSKSEFWNGEDWQLEVVDEAGRQLFILRFHATVLSSQDLPTV